MQYKVLTGLERIVFLQKLQKKIKASLIILLEFKQVKLLLTLLEVLIICRGIKIHHFYD